MRKSVHNEILSRNLAQSVREREANGLAYSRCPANTNDLATPLLGSELTLASRGELRAYIKSETHFLREIDISMCVSVRRSSNA